MRDAAPAPHPGGTAPPDPALAADAADALDRLRTAAPLVQCITDAVVTNFTANVLLAVGVSPAVTDIQGEGGVCAEIADGLLVTTGTPTAHGVDAAREPGARLAELAGCAVAVSGPVDPVLAVAAAARYVRSFGHPSPPGDPS